MEAYDQFVEGVLQKANAPRQKRLEQELACMRELPASRLAEYREYAPVVSSQSLIRVRRHTYSVPSRLIGHKLRVELYEPELKVYLGRDLLFCLPRVRGERGSLVDFRHVVVPLLRVQLARSGKWRATEVRDQMVAPERKVIELAGLTPSLNAYDALLEGEVAHVI